LTFSIYTIKKFFDIPVPSQDVTYQTLPGGNNDVIYKSFPPRESLVSDIPAGDGNIKKLFYSVSYRILNKYTIALPNHIGTLGPRAI
jgi:hypothetical protein